MTVLEVARVVVGREAGRLDREHGGFYVDVPSIGGRPRVKELR